MARPGPEALRARSRWRWTGVRRPPWAEAPGPGQVSVWDFPRPPRIESEPRVVRVEHGGATVAESRRALRVVETAGAPTFYLSPADVDGARLRASDAVSECEWKGRAAYFDVSGPGASALRAVWSYPDPYPEFAALAGWLAFHPGRLDACWLGRDRAQPQPGGLYGGWMTPDLAGPVKGGAGSEGW